MGPDRIAESDELGSRRDERRDVLEARRIGDAGRLEDLGPPGRPLDDALEGGQRAVRPRLAEQQVVGAGFAGVHGVVLGADAADADGALALEALAQLAQAGRASRDMDAVRAAAGRDGGEVDLALRGDDQRGPVLLRRRRQRLDPVDERALVGRREAQQHGRDGSRRAGLARGAARTRRHPRRGA